MTVLFSHTNAIHPNAGGVSRITFNLCKLFHAHSINVKILSLKPVSEKNYKTNSEQFFLPEEQLFSNVNQDYVVDFIGENNIDIVINQSAIDTSTVDFWKAIRDKKEIRVISCIHNSLLTPKYNFPYQFEWEWTHSKKYWLFRITEKKIVRELVVNLYILLYRKNYRKLEAYSDRIVFLCDGLAEEFFKIIGQKSEKVCVIPNFSENKDAIVSKENLILWVGTIDYRVKKVDYILDVWAQIYKKIPTWRLVILGDGPDMESAIEYAKFLKLENFSFEGRIVPDPYYQQAKLICVTSTHEALPMVIIEAMTHGVVPVVNNSFPAAKSLIRDKVNGILVKPFSREEFTKAILELIDTPYSIDNMSNNTIYESIKYNGEHIYYLWQALFTSIS